MGLASKHRKRYVSHKKRWDKKTITQEAVMMSDYALKNKKEIRRAELLISKYKKIAKELNKGVGSEGEEIKNFIESMKAKGFLDTHATTIDEVLDITIREIFERRLSNIVYKNKLAKTPSQARQFVVHRHVMVDGKVINSPSYLVTLAEEPTVQFVEKSPLVDENHPERRLEEIGMEEVDEMEKIPLNEKGPSSDEVEAKLDDEEVDEVAE